MDPKVGEVVNSTDNKVGAEAVATALSPEGAELTKNRFFQAFFDAAKGDESGRFGILSERIFVPVDVITKTQKRKFGLSFTWEDLSIKFTYDLTSVGEVNTKAAMFDILGNLLSIGTNYGNFLTPYIRYDAEYSALTFPGGDAGAKQFYTDIQGFVMANASKMFVGDADTVKTVGGTELTTTSVEESKDALKEIQLALKEGKPIASLDQGLVQKAFAGIQGALAEAAAQNWQAPLSLYTGAPIGEWHLVIGNPYNPIAMIGNLICKSITVSFGEELGPDDFPSTIEATIILAHGRERERGEIESIFNQGDGRFYQTVKSTSSNAQTYRTVVDLAGTVSTNENLNGILSPTSGGVAGSGTTTTFEDIGLGGN